LGLSLRLFEYLKFDHLNAIRHSHFIIPEVPMTLNPQRTLFDLKALRTLTGNADGAQRVAFTPTWVAARQFMQKLLAEIPNVHYHTDPAGNAWATLPGRSEKALLIGGHIDSVPNGGWLDGCLNLVAGVEVLRRLTEQYPASSGGPPVTIKLVDWCDEEGARFGRSLFGSSAFSGALVPDEVRSLKDKDGIALPDAIRPHGIDLDHMLAAQSEQKNAAAYLELHIEQGPVLESKNLPMGVVLGTFGVERHAITFTGQAAHSGSTPMAHRKDALAGVSKLHLAIREIAVQDGGVCTVGSVVTKPGIVTAVVGEATMTLDQRHLDANNLASMYQDAVAASHRIAAEEKIEVAWKKIWTIQPFPFHPHLIDLCDQSISEICGVSHRLPSGPLHDAAEVCRTGIPTIMLFVQSLRGISHNKIEDTREEHLELSVRALDRLADKTIQWINS
jgi:beta-ureidopropionase / N-carbamoyl-L-amino-acid hydrolase